MEDCMITHDEDCALHRAPTDECCDCGAEVEDQAARGLLDILGVPRCEWSEAVPIVIDSFVQSRNRHTERVERENKNRPTTA